MRGVRHLELHTLKNRPSVSNGQRAALLRLLVELPPRVHLHWNHGCDYYSSGSVHDTSDDGPLVAPLVSPSAFRTTGYFPSGITFAAWTSLTRLDVNLNYERHPNATMMAGVPWEQLRAFRSVVQVAHPQHSNPHARAFPHSLRCVSDAWAVFH